MEKNEIIAALENGNYEIKHDEDCSCSFDFRIDGDQIIEDVDGNECWEGMILYVGGEMIAEKIRFGESHMLTDAINPDDIPDEIWDKMRMSDMVERGESANNDTHEANRRESLVYWLNGLADKGYRLMRDNDRGFANEYTVILVSPKTDPDEIGDDWDELDAEKWADEYLYNGDAATEAYNSAKVI